ncbi:uncharacterized protein [Dermacentor andersoni]|uniref:uncharacterized protein n=1 Tax=Dermacentor andersoni TaxID=34620 RepID=UPI003B3B1ED3
MTRHRIGVDRGGRHGDVDLGVDLETNRQLQETAADDYICCDWRFSGSPTRRLVAAGWWLLCTVISCAYCSLLISFMSHPGMEQALDTLPRLPRELLAGRIFVGTTRHTEMELAFTAPFVKAV